jgi:hypothetical protein
MIGFDGEGVRGMKQRSRIFTGTLLGLAVFAIAAPAALGHPFIDRSTSSVSPQIRALQLRSEGMNRQYGTATAIRALQLRSEALNKANGLGVYQGTDALQVRSEALNQQYGVGSTVAASSSDSFNWTEGIAGAAGIFASVLVLAGAIAVTRRQRTTPLGA